MLQNKLKNLLNNLNDKNLSKTLTKMINLTPNKMYQELIYKVLYQHNWIANGIALNGDKATKKLKADSIIDKYHTYSIKSFGKKQRFMMAYTYLGHDAISQRQVRILINSMIKNIYQLKKKAVKDFIIDFIVWIVFVAFMIGEAVYLKMNNTKMGIKTDIPTLAIENTIPMIFANIAIIFNNLRKYKKHMTEYKWAIVIFIICSILLVLGLLFLGSPI